ncbi:MAG: cobalamin-independent methionine synthase II family protein [Roseiflexaceae bacterium]
MKPFQATVVGSFPRNASVTDTMKRPTQSQQQIDAYIRWAVAEQVALGLEIVTDGEGYRENMYYYYQKRVDGIAFEELVPRAFGTAGFAIECPRLVGELKNSRFMIAHNWSIARAAAPAHVRVKQTVTGPHVLTRFTVNQRPDLYPDEQALCRAWARLLRAELEAAVAAGCDYIQFDEPMWTEAPEQSLWAARVLREELVEPLRGRARIALHVCGGNPRRKRVYFTKYTDLVPAFQTVAPDEVSLEHCTLGYDLMELWGAWDFQGDLALGVIDQRSDDLEDTATIRARVAPALAHFPPKRLMLTSECGFGHVPLDITRAKLRALTEACDSFRAGADEG